MIPDIIVDSQRALRKKIRTGINKRPTLMTQPSIMTLESSPERGDSPDPAA